MNQCRCGNQARQGQRCCKSCHAAYMRGWRLDMGVLLTEVFNLGDQCISFQLNYAVGERPTITTRHYVDPMVIEGDKLKTEIKKYKLIHEDDWDNMK